MNNDFLKPIYTEKDLSTYEDYINSPDFKPHKNNTFSSLLKNSKGNTIKIYIAVGNQLTVRQGRLLEVFDDYIAILQNREKLFIKLTEIKFIAMI